MTTMRPNFAEIAKKAASLRKTSDGKPKKTTDDVAQILETNLETSLKIDKTLGT